MIAVDTDDTAQLWVTWADAARHQARALGTQGNLFDCSLKNARAETYARAVAVLRANPDHEQAAKVMMKNAAEVHVRVAPLIGFDQAAVRYTVARTWQRCALMLDSSLDEVQPLWAER